MNIAKVVNKMQTTNNFVHDLSSFIKNEQADKMNNRCRISAMVIRK